MFQWTIRYQLRMQAAEGFCDVTAPANRLVRGKDFWKLLRPNDIPFTGFEVRSEQGRGVIPLVQGADRLAAKNTASSLHTSCLRYSTPGSLVHRLRPVADNPGRSLDARASASIL
jgi:hypothetical protein